MDVDRLSSEELQYELVIRGVIPDATVAQLRAQLRSALKKEKIDKKIKFPTYPFSFNEDEEAVNAGIIVLGGLINDFEDSVHGGSYKKINTKLWHLDGRLKRIKPNDDTETSTVAELQAKLVSLKEQLDNKVRDFETSILGPQGIVGRSEDPTIHTSTPVRPTHNTSFAHSNYETKPVPVAKWGLKFSGDSQGLSLSAFLERVEELRIARNISLETLFNSALDLFTGKALLWYRAYRDLTDNWDDLVKFLREEFQPYDYDDKLIEEIKRRTQGPSESVGVYLAIMQSMFNRLNVEVPENFKLKILLKNIAPFYQDKLSLVPVSSIVELLKLGRQIESRKAALEEFVPPPRKSSGKILEPDLAYVYPEPVASTSRSVNCDAVSGVKCWNCELIGHVAARCPQPLKKRCFKCGKLDVTVRTCPRCSISGNARRGR